MPAAGNMTMRARIERNQDLGTDGFGHPEAPNFQPRNTLPCRVWSKMRQHVTDEEKIVMIEDIRGRFESGADITEDDRISAVVDRRGAVLFDGPLDIVTIAHRRTYKEVVLERFK